MYNSRLHLMGDSFSSRRFPDAEVSLADYLRIGQRHLWKIVLVTAMTIGTTAFLTTLQQSVYRASMKVVVGQGGGVFQAQFGNTVQPFTQTMTNLLTSNIVAESVVVRRSLALTPKQVLGRLSVSVRPESSVLEVNYDSPDRQEAVATLSEVGDVFTSLVARRLGPAEEPANGSGPRLVPITATVFDPAHLEPGRVAPKVVKNLVFAGASGLLLGIMIAMLYETFDNRLRSRRDAEKAFRAPVIGVLPKGFRTKDALSLSMRQAHDNAYLLDSLHILRANVQFFQGGVIGSTILITSALSEEGKSTVCANLAIALAIAGEDVICVEADLRRPRLEKYLSVPSQEAGLVDVVEGRAELDDVLRDVPLDRWARPARSGSRNWLKAVASGSSARHAGAALKSPVTGLSVGPTGRLRVLPAGELAGSAAEVLTAERVEELRDQLSTRATYTIFDSPPLLLVADAFPLVLKLDNVIVVARERRTRKDAAEAVRMTLDGLNARNVSVVLVDSLEQRGYYGQGYQPEADRLRAS